MYADETSSGVSNMKVLALSSNYEPIGIISWFRAITLIYTNKASTLEEYDQIVRSPSVSMRVPAVIIFKNGYVGKNSSRVRFSRKNVWLRDEGKCQYCHNHVSLSNFTIDHIVPKTGGGNTSWENVVACCYSCNQKKGNKSLKEVGYRLIKSPRKPNKLPYLQEFADGQYSIERGIPEPWKFYLER